jgi:MmyB-like transcription regulator ligand binding domain/Helix-turn-helix domain
VSIEYYSKLERGALAGVSAGVLDAIARALQLDDAERAHLFDLAQAADGGSALVRPRRRAAKQWSPRPSLQWTLDAVTEGPALRTEAGRDPHDKDLQNLVGELSTRSDEFRRRWGAHNVRHHGTGAKRFHHQIVGDLTLAYEGLEMAAEPGLTLTIYTAEPGSPSEEALRLLASWAASQEADPDPQTLSVEQRHA